MLVKVTDYYYNSGSPIITEFFRVELNWSKGRKKKPSTPHPLI